MNYPMIKHLNDVIMDKFGDILGALVRETLATIEYDNASNQGAMLCQRNELIYSHGSNTTIKYSYIVIENDGKTIILRYVILHFFVVLLLLNHTKKPSKTTRYYHVSSYESYFQLFEVPQALFSFRWIAVLDLFWSKFNGLQLVLKNWKEHTQITILILHIKFNIFKSIF